MLSYSLQYSTVRYEWIAYTFDDCGAANTVRNVEIFSQTEANASLASIIKYTVNTTTVVLWRWLYTTVILFIVIHTYRVVRQTGSSPLFFYNDEFIQILIFGIFNKCTPRKHYNINCLYLIYFSVQWSTYDGNFIFSSNSVPITTLYTRYTHASCTYLYIRRTVTAIIADCY